MAIAPSTSIASCVASAIGILRADRRQPLAKPEAAAFLEVDGDLARGAVVVAEFGDGVDEAAAAKIPAGETFFEPVEGSQDLFERRPLRGPLLEEAALQIGRDQRILGRKVIVERALGDADFGGDGVDAGGANAGAVEQPFGGVENPLLHRLFLRAAFGDGCHVNRPV